MRQNRRTAAANSGPDKAPAEQVVKDIRRATRRQFSERTTSTAIPRRCLRASGLHGG